MGGFVSRTCTPIVPRAKVDLTLTLKYFKARVGNLMGLMRKIYPKLMESVAAADITSWAGFRPLSIDGVPTISRTKYGNLFLNTGHGHLGWTTAAGSARMLADLVYERAPALAEGDYSIGRF